MRSAVKIMYNGDIVMTLITFIMPVGFIYFYKIVFPLFISGLSSVITQWQLSVKHFQVIKLGLHRKGKWTINK